MGGGIANTFIAAAGHNVGKSLYEADLIPVAKELAANTDIPVPVDVRVGLEFSETAAATEKAVNEVKDDESIFDIGDKSAEQLAEIIKNAKPFYGMAQLACLSSLTSVKGLKSFLTPLQTAMHSLSLVAAIP